MSGSPCIPTGPPPQLPVVALYAKSVTAIPAHAGGGLISLAFLGHPGEGESRTNGYVVVRGRGGNRRPGDVWTWGWFIQKGRAVQEDWAPIEDKRNVPFKCLSRL